MDTAKVTTHTVLRVETVTTVEHFVTFDPAALVTGCKGQLNVQTVALHDASTTTSKGGVLVGHRTDHEDAIVHGDYQWASMVTARGVVVPGDKPLWDINIDEHRSAMHAVHTAEMTPEHVDKAIADTARIEYVDSDNVATTADDVTIPFEDERHRDCCLAALETKYPEDEFERCDEKRCAIKHNHTLQPKVETYLTQYVRRAHASRSTVQIPVYHLAVQPARDKKCGVPGCTTLLFRVTIAEITDNAEE